MSVLFALKERYVAGELVSTTTTPTLTVSLGTSVQQVSCYVSMNVFTLSVTEEFRKFLLTGGLCDCALNTINFDIVLFYSVFHSPIELKLRVTPSRMFSS